MKDYPKYKITYLGVGVVQEKYLIPQLVYNDFIVPTKKLISDLEALNNGKPTRSSKLLRDSLKRNFPDNFFTDGSELFKAISTGVLSCNNYISNVKIDLL